MPTNSEIQKAQRGFFDTYSRAIKTGTNDINKLKQYQEYGKAFGLKSVTPDDPTMKRLSISALNGDKNAQSYLKTMGLKSQSGSSLWNGYDASKLKQGSGAWTQYMKDNPMSTVAKNYDMNTYNTYGNTIANGGAISDGQMQSYLKAVNKWNLEDMNNSFVKQRSQLEKDKTTALNAQDVALNQGLGQIDANAFQQMQTVQQQMVDRGLGSSGLAADAYMRSQMANNQDYQQAYSDAATNKSGIQSEFNSAISESRINQEQFESEQAIARQNAEITLLEQQTEVDKYLTTSTGYVYMNGQMLTLNGKPVTSLEYQKLSETQRHNMATENNTAMKNAQDYALGSDSNMIKREQIAADLQVQTAKMKLDYAKLDYNYAKLESDNAIAQDKIKIAADNAQTSADKNKITALGKQLDAVTKRITAAQKAGKKPSKSDVEAYNNITGQLQSLSGNFKSSSGGGGTNSLGSLSKKYESGSSGAGTIGNNAGDWGGKSYGTYQIASNTGTMNSFMSYLKKTNPTIYNTLAKHKVGSSGFDGAWKSLAGNQGIQFQAAQHAFIKQSHYDPAVSRLNQIAGINANSRSLALQNVIWSIGVQHGSGGAANIFKAAGIKNGMNDREIIQRLYAERMKVNKYFSRSSQSIRNSVYNRFQNELKDALAML